MFQTQQNLKTCLTSEILLQQGTLLEILGAILMCSSRFQYKLSDLLKMLWKVKHILPNGGLTVIYHGNKVN